MRTSFLRTHLDIWIPLPTFRHTETFCHLLTCCPHSPPGLKIRTCTNVTPVTHLQTQTSKFEIYSADNLLFQHCQRKGRLKHLPAYISWLLQQDLQLFCLRTQNLKCNLPNNLPRDGFISIFLRDLWRCFFRICKPMLNKLPRWFSLEYYCQQ